MAQQHRVAIGELKGLVNPGHEANIKEAEKQFGRLASEIEKRAEL
jgi:hypothetical protein